MPEAARKPAGEVDKTAEVDKREEAGRPEAVDRRVEEASGIQAAAGKPVGVWQEEVDRQAEVDKPGEEAEIAVEEPLLLRQAYHKTRKSGHYPQDYGRNRYKNAEPFFTSLADFIRVQLLWHI